MAKTKHAWSFDAALFVIETLSGANHACSKYRSANFGTVLGGNACQAGAIVELKGPGSHFSQVETSLFLIDSNVRVIKPRPAASFRLTPGASGFFYFRIEPRVAKRLVLVERQPDVV